MCTFTPTKPHALRYHVARIEVEQDVDKHGHFEIETFELGRALWHARFRRLYRQPVSIDGVLFETLNIGFAWPTSEAALADARNYIERMSWRLANS
jgi:hypothetical protein